MHLHHHHQRPARRDVYCDSLIVTQNNNFSILPKSAVVMTKLNRPEYTSVDHKHNIAIVVDHSNDPCVYPDLIITYTLDQTHVNPSPRRCVRRITAAMDAINYYVSHPGRPQTTQTDYDNQISDCIFLSLPLYSFTPTLPFSLDPLFAH